MARPTTEVVTREGAEVRVFQACRIDVAPPHAPALSVVMDKTPFRVGSHDTNDLVLDDDTVSKHHLQIDVGPSGYRIVDLASRNGTFLRTARVHDLTAGEPIQLRVGQTRLRIEPIDQRIEIPAATEDRLGALLGRSVVMRELFAHMRRVAALECPVLIEGEAGTGKELCAETLHQLSPRAGQPFVVVDCAAVSADVVESELFGHLKGAYTGADEERPGLIEMAAGGSLFLDEISALPPRLQSRLVGLLDRGEITPLGASEPRNLDVRVMAATRADLARETNAGTFRAEVFYRLAIARLHVPPLRDRLEDVPLLVEAALAALRERGVPDVPRQLSAVVMARLAAQPWVGNVRELFGAIERAVLADSRGHSAAAEEPELPFSAAREQVIADFTLSTLSAALERAGGNVAQAAREVGVEQRYFRRLLEKHRPPRGESSDE
jgi:DNA-binding NtrC family response regulator